MLRIIIPILALICYGSSFSQTIKTTETDSIKTETISIKTDSTKTETIAIKTDTINKEQKRLKFGCGVGLNFVGGTNINLSPNLTYIVSDKVSFRGGLQGNYSSIKNLQNTMTFGANVMGIYRPVKKLSLLLEFAELRVITERETDQVKNKVKFWDSALFVGAGLNITRKILVGAKYNMLYDKNESAYTSAIVPFVNIGF